MSKKSVAVRIAGHEYKIRSDADEESLRQIALYVDNAMQKVRKGTGTVDSFDVAVLTCLNLGRELLALKGEGQSVSPASHSSMRALIERVEAACGTSTLPESAKVDGREREGEGATGDTTDPVTLDLASVEAFPDRTETESDEASALDADADPVPEKRMAAGGRDRAS